MSLKYQMDSLEGVDNSIAQLYEEADGKFVLSGISGVVPKSKLDEFRDNNIKLKTKLETFDGIDVDKVKKIKTELEEANIKLENRGEVDEEVLKRLVESRVAAVREEYGESKSKLETKVQAQERMLEELIINGNVTSAASKSKVLTTAITDVMLRAKSTFKLVEGKPVAYNSDGDKMYGPDGMTELTIDDWLKGLKKSSPHLFEQSESGGLGGGIGGRANLNSKDMSPQQKIFQGLN